MRFVFRSLEERFDKLNANGPRDKKVVRCASRTFFLSSPNPFALSPSKGSYANEGEERLEELNLNCTKKAVRTPHVLPLLS